MFISHKIWRYKFVFPVCPLSCFFSLLACSSLMRKSKYILLKSCLIPKRCRKSLYILSHSLIMIPVFSGWLLGHQFRSHQYFNLPVPLSHHNFCPFLTSAVLLRAPAREGHQEPSLNRSIFQFLMAVNVWARCQPVPPCNSGRTSDCVHQSGTDTSRPSWLPQ